MRVLFLDDIQERHDEFNKFLKKPLFRHLEVDHVYNVDEAKQALENNFYHFAFLDHDLEDYHLDLETGTNYEKTGMEVANFVTEMANPPLLVLVHSWNNTRARDMCGRLSAVTRAIQAPFGPASLGVFESILLETWEQES